MPAQTCARCHAPADRSLPVLPGMRLRLRLPSRWTRPAPPRAARRGRKPRLRSARRRSEAPARATAGRRRYVVRGLIAFEVVALAALAGYGILTNVTDGPDIAAVFATPRPTPSATPTPAVTLPATGFVPTGPTTEATVERVVDGDTIVVDADGVQLYVRYSGWTPPRRSSSTPRSSSWPPRRPRPTPSWSAARRSSSSATCPRRTTSARLLRHVWVDRDGTLFLVGLELVKAGFAQATPLPPDTKYDDPLRRRRGRRPRPPAWASGAPRPARGPRRAARRTARPRRFGRSPAWRPVRSPRTAASSVAGSASTTGRR